MQAILSPACNHGSKRNGAGPPQLLLRLPGEPGHGMPILYCGECMQCECAPKHVYQVHAHNQLTPHLIVEPLISSTSP